MASATANTVSIGATSLLPGPPAAMLTQKAPTAAKATALQKPFCVLIFIPPIQPEI
jgi:hypothetical protein